MQSVQLKINKENLVNHLRYAFTNKDTVISELMQNARRAGSDYVSFEYDEDKKILIVEDQGCGIDDPQTILTIAESGWSEETKQSETPYGLGFMSALFSAERVQIESNRLSIEFYTESVLNFNMISVFPSEKETGTRITLTGIDINVESAVSRFSSGFPIDVYFNGEKNARSHALDSLDYIEDTSIGQARIREIHEPITRSVAYGTRDIIVYLQGIQVYRSNAAHNTNANIIHLDPTQFKGRLPDRDKLIDERDVVNQIQSVITAQWQKRLCEDVASLDDAVIAQHYFETLRFWNQLKLFNHINYLPSDILAVYDIYPINFNDYEDRRPTYTGSLISRDDLASGNIKVFDLNEDLCQYQPFQVSMYAYYLDALYLNRYGLSQDHWIHEHLVTVDVDDITMTLEQPSDQYSVGCNWFTANTVFCKRAVLHGPCGDVTINSDAFYYADGFLYTKGMPAAIYEQGTIVIPDGESSGQVVRQMASYQTEYGDYLEHDMDEDSTNIENFIIAHRPGQELHLLKRLLTDAGLMRFDCLVDKTFKLTVLKEFDKDTKSHFRLEFE